MREVKFRAYDNIKNMVFDVWDFRILDKGLRINEGEHFDRTVGLLQFTGLKDKNGKDVYENDIVKILTDRKPAYSNLKQSQFDIQKIEARAIVMYEKCKFMLETNIEWNKKILELKGKETDERRLQIWKELSDYDCWNEWNLKHNPHAYWHQLEIIGNIYENPNLLEAENDNMSS